MIDYSLCDKSIIPLLKKINSKSWIKTLYSCGGKREHTNGVNTPAYISSISAYITFITNDVLKVVQWFEETRRIQLELYNHGVSSIDVHLDIDESKFNTNLDSVIPKGWVRFVLRAAYGSEEDWGWLESQ